MIQFHEEFRIACEKNVCRKYDTNWMGPPAIGPIRELKEKATRYRQGMLFQTVHAVKSNFDMKGMLAAAGVHEKVFRELLARIRHAYPGEDILHSMPCCSICERCAYLDRSRAATPTLP
jgi:predicted metal-binding protein